MRATQRVTLVLASVLLAACSAAGGTTGASSTENEVQADACETVPADSLAESSRAFLFAEGLAGPYDELEIGGGMRTRWLPVSALRAPTDRESAPGTCLLRMNLAIETKTPSGETKTSTSDQWEVIAFDAETKALQRFEQAIAIPERIQVALGQPFEIIDGETVPGTSFYYVELADAPALSTMKSVFGAIQYPGLSAAISAKNVRIESYRLVGEPDGPAAFDPTPGRTWKLKDVNYSLRRGSSAEILDVYPNQLDGDFDAYFSGSDGKIAPWNAVVRRWKEPTETAWREVEPTL